MIRNMFKRFAPNNNVSQNIKNLRMLADIMHIVRNPPVHRNMFTQTMAGKKCHKTRWVPDYDTAETLIRKILDKGGNND